MASLFTEGKFQALDSSGNPLSGGKLYTYAAGTLTNKATYTTQAGTVANANPVVLDSSGRAAVWLGSGGYRMILKTSADVTVWDEDGIAGVAADSVSFEAAGTGAVSRSMEEKARERISVSDFLTADELAAVQAGASAVDVSAAVRRAVVAAAGRDLWFDAPGTYYMATADAGAYITLSTAGTRLRLEKAAKLRFADAAVYGINITAQLCSVQDGLLWGTNTTAPTIISMVHVDAPYCEVRGTNIAYALIGTHVDGAYIVRHENNSYSHCDRFFYTSGSCADIQSRGNTYGTTTIGSNAVVEIAGSGGAVLDDYWEMQSRTKLALKCPTGSQRINVGGKFFDSGGVEVQGSVYLRLDAEMLDSYTGTIGIDVQSGATLDCTGAYLNGPGSTSGVEAINGDGVVIMGAGVLTEWQTAVDVNSVVAIGNVLVSQCTTAWDVATAASGKIVDCAYSGVTTKLVRTSSATVSVPDIFTASATYDPTSLADGAGVSGTITVTGTLAGDSVQLTFGSDLQGVGLHAWCTADTVNYRFQNETGGTVDLPSSTLRATVSTKTI